MKKTLITLAVGCVLGAPAFATAADAKANGFADIIYTIQDEPADKTGADAAGNANTKNPNKGKFSANGEVDFSVSPAEGVTARVDTDLALGTNGGTNACGVNGAGPCDSAVIEQAFFAWGVANNVTVLGGVFNDPIGQDAEDAPDMNFTSHTAVYNILDNQTTLYGNNIAGVAVAGAMGPVNVTVGVLNDLGQVNEKNSLALVLNAAPVKDLAVELGYVTHDKQSVGGSATTAGNVWDVNGSYTISGFIVGLDYLGPQEIIDSAYNVWLGYDFGHGFGAKVRYDSVTYTGSAVKDESATTLHLSYHAASNLDVALEFTSGDNPNLKKVAGVGQGVDPITGIGDGATSTLEFIAIF
jgi:hypothetical protein